MFRKLGYAALALIAIATMTGNAYDFTAYSRVNSYVLRQHDTVARLGDAAPFEARAAVALSRLPNEWFNFISPAQAQQQPAITIDRGNLRNHQSFSCGTRPTVSGATLTSGSCDFRGQFTAPTSQAPVVTFGTAYQSAPICTVTRSDGQSTTGHSYTVSTTALTFASVTTGATTVINWICLGVML